jgi:hypothetical protein
MQTESSGPNSWAGLCPPHLLYRTAGRPRSGRPLGRTRSCRSGGKSDGRKDVGAECRVFRATRPRSRLVRMGQRPAGLPSSGARWRGDHRCYNVLRGKDNKIKRFSKFKKKTKPTKKREKTLGETSKKGEEKRRKLQKLERRIKMCAKNSFSRTSIKMI